MNYEIKRFAFSNLFLNNLNTRKSLRLGMRLEKHYNDMINPWFKFYGSEYLSDPKIGSLSPQERSCWITLLCMASASSLPGVIEYLTVEVLLQKSGINFDPYHPEEWDKCLSILKRLEKLRMVALNENGTIEIINWDKRQEHNLTVAERVAKSRANKKCNENVTIDVTSVTTEENRKEENREEESNTCPTPLGTAKDTEKENAFNAFWESYPRKDNKKTSKTRFMNLSPKLYPKIMEALEVHKRSRQWQSPEYIPQPSTWLNQQRWEDEVKAVAPIDPMEAYALELVKKFPPENDTVAEFRFSAKYGAQNLLKFKNLFKL
jgi:hypothetical protein